MTKREFTLVGITVLIMCIPLAIIAWKAAAQGNLPSTALDWNTIKAVKTKSGESRPFFDSPTATLDELECHVTTLDPGQSPHAPHQHPEEEMMLVKEGTVETLVNGEVKRVGPGSVIFQASNQLHSIKNVGNGQATYFVIKWKSAKTGGAIK